MIHFLPFVAWLLTLPGSGDCDPMTSQPPIQVGTTDSDDLCGDSDEGQATTVSPVPNCPGRDSADIGGGGGVVKDFVGGRI